MAKQVSPKPYLREVSRTRWFLRHETYLRYMARELTCIFIGIYTMLLLVGIWRLSQGQAAYGAFLQALRSPVSIVFHVVALAFSVYHSVTWFNLTPKALPVQRGEEFVPDSVIVGAHYVGWVVLSVVIIFLAGVF
jgi:fumarate reductase subunit C